VSDQARPWQAAVPGVLWRVRWLAVRTEHLTIHEISGTTADVTEGTPAGIGISWERCRYDWSEPGQVTATATDSNVYA
jgi:hypothetical protein